MHTQYLSQCLRLAARGHTSPNPRVGAVIVKKGKVIAQGYHVRAGLAHAEAAALKKAGKDARGATLYVSLEPCCHTKKLTPPCTEAIIAAGIKEVVIASQDPNPLVAGKGLKRLRQAGIRVNLINDQEIQNAASVLNRYYNYSIVNKRPFVILKSAASLDGKIALASGQSKWITGETARVHSHSLRAEVDAILVGVGTVLQDNPQLTAREKNRLSQHQPRAIVLDPHLKTPLKFNVVRETTLMICAPKALKSAKAKSLQQRGVQVQAIPYHPQKGFNLKALLKYLSQEKIISVLVEGGALTISAFIAQACWNQFYFYQAPKIIGAEGKNMFAGLNVKSLSNKLKRENVLQLGEDTLQIFKNYLP